MVTKKMVGVLAVAAAAVALGQEAYGTVTAAEVTAVVRGAGDCTHKSTSHTCEKSGGFFAPKCATGSINWAQTTTKEGDKNTEAGGNVELCKIGTAEERDRCVSYTKEKTKTSEPACSTPNTSN